MLLRTIKHQLDDLSDQKHFLHTVMEGRSFVLVVNGAAVKAWIRARIGRLRMQAGDIAVWSNAGRCFGRVRGILEVDGVAHISVYTMTAVGHGLLTLGADECLVVCTRVENVLVYVESAGRPFRVLMPT